MNANTGTTPVPDSPPEITLQPCPASVELEAEWKDLETRAEASFFQTWAWIGTWLETIENRPHLLRARCDGETIALGFIAKTNRFPNTSYYVLNQTGKEPENTIYIEYNGLLCDRRHPETENHCWQWLTRQIKSPIPGLSPEFHLERLKEESFRQLASGKVRCHVEKLDIAPFVNLNTIRAEGGDFAATLSRNTRHQMRRTERLYSMMGQINVTSARTLEEAECFFAGLIDLHQRSWNNRGREGAFANPFFRRFHEQLVRNSFKLGCIDLIRITLDSEVVGYLYNFIHENCAQSYQCGFSYLEDNRYKPGLFCHSLAAQKYLAEGLGSYNFLAGDNRFKRSLSNDEDTLYTVSVSRKQAPKKRS